MIENSDDDVFEEENATTIQLVKKLKLKFFIKQS